MLLEVNHLSDEEVELPCNHVEGEPHMQLLQMLVICSGETQTTMTA